MILVTGGAGYIGSQLAQALHHNGHELVILDDLSTGDGKSIAQGKFVIGDYGDAQLISGIFSRYPISGVIHLAAKTSVSESVANPLLYYKKNTLNLAPLLECCLKHPIAFFIYSSTAAVYGQAQSPVSENSPCQPINPYGWSKYMAERLIIDTFASRIPYMVLRYFNVAGSDPMHNLGPYQKNSPLLMRMAAQVALGIHEKLQVYGDNFPTPDGTGVRDYIHVADLAKAHLAAIHYLKQGNKSCILNCGYGHGFSVREIIHMFEEVCQHRLPYEIKPARTGDPAEIIADVQNIKKALLWQPEHDDLKKIVTDTWLWEKKLWEMSNP